jgi:hypothetical protein
VKRIIVALDASDRAGLVLAAAAHLAELAGAKLVLWSARPAMRGAPGSTCSPIKHAALRRMTSRSEPGAMARSS